MFDRRDFVECVALPSARVYELGGRSSRFDHDIGRVHDADDSAGLCSRFPVQQHKKRLMVRRSPCLGQHCFCVSVGGFPFPGSHTNPRRCPCVAGRGVFGEEIRERKVEHRIKKLVSPSDGETSFSWFVIYVTLLFQSQITEQSFIYWCFKLQ